MLNVITPPIKFDKLSLFGFASAVAAVLHSLSFPERIGFEHPSSLALVLAAVLVILLPQRLGPYLLLLACSLANTFDWMPYAPNHITFEFIVDIGILTALTWFITRHYLQQGTTADLQTPAGREALLSSFAPFARVSLLIMYFYAVLHKLNWDYFNPDISCSTFLFEWYARKLPLLPDNAAAEWLAVWGTLAVEAAIPLLLCFRNTRSAGILLGFGFHYLLSVHPHEGLYSFSAMLFAFYVLFMSPALLERAGRLGKLLFGDAQHRVIANTRLVISGSVLLLLALTLSGTNYNSTRLGLIIWLGWGLLVIVTYLLVTITSKNKLATESATTLFKLRPAAFWLIPVLVFFNGFNPYLGLKTQTSFSMFSNLRTEGGISNHVLIPSSLQLYDMQKDLIEITDSNLPALTQFVTDQQLITYFELRRIVSEADTSFHAGYIRHGQRQTIDVVNGRSNQPDLLVPHNWLVAKFVRFRPVDKGPCLCKH